jgi:hypothetical protein
LGRGVGKSDFVGISNPSGISDKILEQIDKSLVYFMQNIRNTFGLASTFE